MRVVRGSSIAVLLLALVAFVAMASAAAAGRLPVRLTKSDQQINKTLAGSSTRVDLDVPPRYMWGWGDGLRGYCGETSFQSFGLLFGNYITSEAIRNAADSHELLIAVNDEIAANNLRFAYEEWDYSRETVPQGKRFASWAADHIDAGHGVVGGFFEQVDGGDPDYDHIMPITGYLRDDAAFERRQQLIAAGKLDKRTTPRDDVLGIYYNDLYRPTELFGDLSAGFIEDRKECSAPNGIQPLSAPYQFCLPEDYNYGIAILGNRDEMNELYPVRLDASSWTEPDYGLEDQIHAPVTTMTFNLTVSGLTAGQSYSILRFDHWHMVPVEEFSRGAYAKRVDFVADGDVAQFPNFETHPTDATVFYRCVKKTSG